MIIFLVYLTTWQYHIPKESFYGMKKRMIRTRWQLYTFYVYNYFMLFCVAQKAANTGKGENGPSAKRMRISTTAAPSHHSDAQVCYWRLWLCSVYFLSTRPPLNITYLHLQPTSNQVVILKQPSHMNNMEQDLSLVQLVNIPLPFITTLSDISREKTYQNNII